MNTETYSRPAIMAVALWLSACSTLEDTHPLSTIDFTPPTNLTVTPVKLQGGLQFRPVKENSRSHVLIDTYDAVLTPEWDITHLPAVEIEFVQDGRDVIPVQRGAQASTHPYWEWIFEPGKAWEETDKPGWTSVVLPFALQERNQNCTHYGLVRFSFSDDGSTSPADYLVGSETCQYLKVNLYGSLELSYQPYIIGNADEIIKRHRKLVENRLPVKPLSELVQDYPGVDLQAFIPPGPEDITVFGLIIGGTHYRDGCQTRFGPHPFCEWLDLPSYSVAKSIFAGLTAMYLEQQHPGFLQIEVEELVPECRLPDGRWKGVTLRHLLNMRTGNYDSTGFEVDEGATNVASFFLPETHAEKIKFSCETFQRKSPPGDMFVYHTFDTYLLGTAMNAFLKRQDEEADVFQDTLVTDLFGPLELSPVAYTSRRTYDSVEQPFTGYGLTWNPDDIARIGLWLNHEAAHQQFFAGNNEFGFAMFNNGTPIRKLAGSRGEAYRNGFWGFDVSPWAGCKNPAWVPFMAGYGGNIVALIPNGSVYYYFSDGNRFKWAGAAAETNKMSVYCE